MSARMAVNNYTTLMCFHIMLLYLIYLKATSHSLQDAGTDGREAVCQRQVDGDADQRYLKLLDNCGHWLLWVCVVICTCSMFFMCLYGFLCILCFSADALFLVTGFLSPSYPSISDLSNLIFLCGTLITAYQKQTYPCHITLYKLQNMSWHKAGIMANGRTLCHFSRGIKMAFNTTSAFFHLRNLSSTFPFSCGILKLTSEENAKKTKKSKPGYCMLKQLVIMMAHWVTNGFSKSLLSAKKQLDPSFVVPFISQSACRILSRSLSTTALSVLLWWFCKEF